LKIKLFVLFIVVLTLGLSGFFYLKRKEKIISVSSYTVKKRDLKITVIARGEVASESKHKINAPISGQIKGIMKQEGDIVKKGEILLIFDTSSQLARLKEVERNIIEVENRLLELNEGIEIERARKAFSEIELALQEAKKEHGSQKILYEKGAIPEKEYFASLLNLQRNEEEYKLREKELSSIIKRNEAERRLLEYNLEKEKANYKEQEKNLSFTEVKSPINGIIIQKAEGIEEEGFVSQGTSHLFTIASLQYEVSCSVDEQDIGNIKLGQLATVILDAYPYKPIEGKIKKVSSTVSSEEYGRIKTKSFPIRLSINKPDDIELYPGMSGDVKINLSFKDRLVIPFDAVFGTREKKYVFLIEKDRVKKIKIKTGLESIDKFEVLEGLKEGDRIVLNPPENLEEDTLCKVRK